MPENDTRAHSPIGQTAPDAAEPPRRRQCASEQRPRRCRRSSRGVGSRREPASKAVLAHAGAAALDNDNQHDNEQNTGNNPDHHGTVHFDLLLLGKQAKVSVEFGTWPVGQVPEHVEARAGPMASRRGRALLDVGAAALDEDAEHGDKQHASDNPNHHDTVHIDLPSLIFRASL